MRLIWIFLLLCIQASAQHYTPVDSIGAVQFVIKNFGVSVEGTLHGLKGEIYFNELQPESSYFNIQVGANTINTGIGLRNKHLKKEEYFFTEKFPVIIFKSNQFTIGKNGAPNQLIGTLTIKGIKKEIIISFTSTGTTTKIFKGEFTLNRQHFKVGGNNLGMADEVLVKLNVTAHMVK